MSKQADEVVNYYRSTNFDYEHFWADRKAQALHFGYYEHADTSHRQALLNMNVKLAQLTDIKPSEKVFDAGCGYGGSALWLAENIGCQVVGMTIVPYQVAKAVKLAKKSPAASKLEFLKGDYTATGLAPASFDVVWGLESIVHCDKKVRFIREAYRLLKPGGRLVIAEYLLRHKPPLSTEEYSSLRLWLNGWKMPNLLDPEQYKNYCQKAGLTDFKFYDWSNQVSPSLRKCRRQASLALPFVGFLHKLNLIDSIRRDYTKANYYFYDSFVDKLWFYGVIHATKPRI